VYQDIRLSGCWTSGKQGFRYEKDYLKTKKSKCKVQNYKSKIQKRFQVINPLKELMEQGKNVPDTFNCPLPRIAGGGR